MDIDATPNSKKRRMAASGDISRSNMGTSVQNLSDGFMNSKEEWWWKQQKAFHMTVAAKLNLDSKLQADSWEILSRFLEMNGGSSNAKATHADVKFAAAISIWCASVLSRGSTGEDRMNLIPISQLTSSTDMKESIFFKLSEQFIQTLFQEKSEEFKRLSLELNVIKCDYSGMKCADERLKALFDILFNFEYSKQYGQELYKFAWMLFIYCKERLIPASHLTLNNIMFVMIYSLRFISNHVPKPNLRTIEFVFHRLRIGDMDDQTKDQIWIMQGTKVLNIICHMFQLSFEQLKAQEKMFLQCINEEFISTKEWHYVSMGKHPETGAPMLVGSFEPENLTAIHKNCATLEKKYDYQFHLSGGRCDGRLFVESFIAVQQNGKLSRNENDRGNHGNIPAAPRKFVTPRTKLLKTPAIRNLKHEFEKSCSLDSSMAATPLTARSMPNRHLRQVVLDDNATAERLEMILCGQREGPSDDLLEFFKRSDPDPTDHIVERSRKMVELLIKSCPASENRWRLASKLYFRVLETMLKGEEARTGTKINFSALLQNSKFHRSIILCSVELIRYCFKINNITLEQLMASLDVKPFDLCVAIEYCIKYDGRLLNWNLIKRLKEMEERILERELWLHEYPLYTELLEDMKSSRSSAEISSPRKALNFVVAKPSYFTGDHTCENHSLSQIQNVQTKSNVTSLELLFRKLFRLIHTRLTILGVEIGIPEPVVAKIWALLVEIALNEYQWRLLYKRHVDSIILCSIYAIYKMLDQDIAFTKLVDHYQKQPQYDESAVSNLEIGGDEKSHIIVFFNKCFVPAVKDTIYGNRLSTTNYMMPMSPRKFQFGFKSPLRAQAHPDMILTPRTKKLSHPVDGTAVKAFRARNERVGKRQVKKLNFGASQQKRNISR